MRIKLFLIPLFAVLFPVFLTAQKVEYDKVNALNKRIMYTSWEKVNWNSETGKLEVCMLLEGHDMSLMINWQSQEMVGAERDSEVTLTFDDDSEIVLHNKAFSVSGAGKVHSKAVPATSMGIQIDAKGDFRPITEKTLKNIRIETTLGKVDFPVNEEEALALANLYNVFEKQYFKDRSN